MKSWGGVLTSGQVAKARDLEELVVLFDVAGQPGTRDEGVVVAEIQRRPGRCGFHAERVRVRVRVRCDVEDQGG